MTIIKFEPIYKERPWGGTVLEKRFNRKIHLESDKIGESWEIVDRPEAQSIILNTLNKGMSLRRLIVEQCTSIMGPKWKKESRFPVLIKWLDCSERLSLQVHPPLYVADKFGGEPKTENWYVAGASENAGLFIGLKNDTDKNLFKAALASNKAESLCHRIDSAVGDSILVDSGRIHAIDGGNLILEIQQNSDTTYRVYDWGRLGVDNEPRQLHIEESLRCIDFNDIEPKLLKTQKAVGQSIIAKCDLFKIRKFNSTAGKKVFIKKSSVDCSIIHLISGSISVGEELIGVGEQAMSPFFSDCTIDILKDSTFLITDEFINHQSLTKIVSN
jgi:mannose-6-phosphate isomerase